MSAGLGSEKALLGGFDRTLLTDDGMFGQSGGVIPAGFG